MNLFGASAPGGAGHPGGAGREGAVAFTRGGLPGRSAALPGHDGGEVLGLGGGWGGREKPGMFLLFLLNVRHVYNMKHLMIWEHEKVWWLQPIPGCGWVGGIGPGRGHHGGSRAEIVVAQAQRASPACECQADPGLVNQLDGQKNTPIMEAAFLGRCMIVKELVERRLTGRGGLETGG